MTKLTIEELKQALKRLPDWELAKDRELPQLERNDLTYSSIGDQQKETILAAGLALQKAGVIEADVDVKAAVDALVDTDFPVAAQ